MPVHSLSIKIADIVVKVNSGIDFARFNDFGFYKDFMTDSSAPSHCQLEHTIGPPPDLTPDERPFSPQDVWQLSRSGSRNVLRVGPPPEQGLPDNVVIFNNDYSEGVMYQDTVYELFRRFIDQFLIINLLSQNNGFLLHASGVALEGKGLCFVGRSGAGKSTLLNLFSDDVDRRSLLNDDRLALRHYGGLWRLFGTPWYGESRVSSSACAGLSAIFFIRQSKHNYVRKLSASEICPHLTVLSLLPYWDEEGVSRVLETYQHLIRTIPAFELGFLPDKSAVELIKKTVKEL